MAVLATYNVKGGVGKTATVVNLAHRAAVAGAGEGARTLVFDLDPQGAASYYFRAAPKVRRRGKSLVRGKVDVLDAITPTDFAGLDLIPSDFSFRNLDVVLDGVRDPGRSLARVVRPLSKRYDHIFLDCPPSISRLSENVFNAADALLVPIIPTTLSLRALNQLDSFLARRKERSPLVLPFFSMFDRRKRLHRELIEDLSLAHPDILRAGVPSAAAVERMGAHQAPVAAFDRRSPAVAAYAGLWDEVLARMAASPARARARSRAQA
ncbi:MAG TPA: ParA family protein [Acidimicrobiia bacterium]|nr:ParA family protein [Acidimicrobiia bacterium]HMC79275.1 ParA family protein [Acidimicrobiia bacterium]